MNTCTPLSPLRPHIHLPKAQIQLNIALQMFHTQTGEHEDLSSLISRLYQAIPSPSSNPLHPSFSCLPQQQVILCAQFLGKTKVTRRELTQDLTSPASPALVPTLCALLPGTKGCTPTQTSGPSLLTHQEHHVTSPPTATGLHPLLFLPIGTDMPEFLFP